MIPSLKFKLVHPHAQLPFKKRKEDAGYDLFTPQDIVIDPMSQELIDLGIESEFPDCWVVQIVDRSSVALKGCHITAGIIDSSYRGRWKISMWNLGDKAIAFSTGEKVAQFLLLPIVNLLPRSVNDLSESDRGEGGFGSSGRF